MLWGIMSRRCPALVFLVFVAAVGTGCGGSAELPEDPVQVLEVLGACPEGDALWRQALGRAGDPEALEVLAGSIGKIGEGCPERWEPLWTVGETYFRRFMAGEARAAYESALARARELDDPEGIACSANRLGSLSYFSGDLAGAKQQFNQALTAARAASREDLTAFILNNLAGVLRDHGELPRAIVVSEEAVGLLSRLELTAPARQAAYNQAALSLELGDVGQSRATLQTIYAESVDAGDERTASHCSLAMGNLSLALDDYDAAREWFDKATDGSPQTQVTIEMGLGLADLEQGRLDSAERRLDRAAQIALENEMTLEGLLADAWKSDVARRQGRGDDAVRRLRQVVNSAEEIGSAQKAARIANWLIGRVHLQRGETDAAVAALREAVSIVESLGDRLDPMGSGLHFLLKRTDPYTDLALALAASGSEQEVFSVVESAHARALRQAIGARAEPAETTLGELQRTLQPGELILDYLLGREAGVLVAVGRDRVSVQRIEGWQELEEPLRRYRAALQRPLTSFASRAEAGADLRRDIDAGHALRESLLGPVWDRVEQAQRVYVVPDRDLALLPFAALPLAPGSEDDATRFLGEIIEVALMPMAGVPPARDPVRGPIFLGGNPRPDSEGRFAALPRTRLELGGIEKVWGETATRSLSGSEFSVDKFQEQPLAEFGAIHLATHALASTLDPRKCAVVFDRGESLAFDRISELSLGPSLVVLSACRSGEGESIPGQGVVGLGWAFLLGGARGLAVSLWSVEDAAASDLMIEFHRQLESGVDPVRALALAQEHLREDQAHPAFWAPFVIYLNPSSG